MTEIGRDEHIAPFEQFALIFINRDGNGNSIVRRLLKKDFSGVVILKKIDDRWIGINFYANKFQLDFAKYNYEAIKKLGKHRVLEIRVNEVEYKKDPVKLIMGPIRCVEITKMFLGIQRKRILTPWQLYKYIKSSNVGKFGITVTKEI